MAKMTASEKNKKMGNTSTYPDGSPMYPRGREKPIKELEKLYGDKFDIKSVTARNAARKKKKAARAKKKAAETDAMLKDAEKKAAAMEKAAIQKKSRPQPSAQRKRRAKQNRSKG